MATRQSVLLSTERRSRTPVLASFRTALAVLSTDMRSSEGIRGSRNLGIDGAVKLLELQGANGKSSNVICEVRGQVLPRQGYFKRWHEEVFL